MTGVPWRLSPDRCFGADPARRAVPRDVWRRVSCDWLAGLVVEGRLADDDAAEMARACATDFARRAYQVPEA